MTKKITLILTLAIFLLTGLGLFGCSGSNTKYNVNVATVANGQISVSTKKAKANEKVTVTLTPNQGYKYKEGTLKYNDSLINEFTFVMPKKEVVITAEFDERLTGKYQITMGEMFDGIVVADRESADHGVKVTLTVTPDAGYKITTGSLRYNGVKITDSTFEMPDADVVITADFELVNKTIYKRIDKDGNEDANGDYLLFGTYPKSIKADNIKMSAKPDTKGFYTGSDGEKYSKFSGNPYGTSYTFTNGEKILYGTEYYFKLEAIKWRIIRTVDGLNTLLCEDIIDAQVFNSSTSDNNTGGEIFFASNWEKSTMRTWLNSTFYGRAFHNGQQALIESSWVDNKTTAHLGMQNVNATIQKDTSDNVFLLSFKDSINKEYGFNETGANDNARRKMTTDYARARGSYMFTGSGLSVGCGWWHLRSASASNKTYNSGIGDGGEIDMQGGSVNLMNHGVVPVIRIRL